MVDDTGTSYYSHINGVDCMGRSVRAESDVFVCDESPPLIAKLARPTLRQASRSFVSLLGSALADWRDVFTELESTMASYEVCVSVLPVRCPLWIPAGLELSIEVALPTGGNISHLVVVVRATNGAGLFAEATSPAVRVRAEPNPTLKRVTADEFGVGEGYTGSMGCRLNSSGVEVTWAGVDMAVLDSDLGLRQHSLTLSVLDSEQGLQLLPKRKLEAVDGGSVIVALPGTLVDGTALELRLTVSTLLSDSYLGLACLLDRSPPTRGQLSFSSGEMLHETVFLHRPRHPPRVCVAGFEDLHSGVVEIAISIATFPAGVHLYSTRIPTAGCVNLTMSLAHGAMLQATAFATNGAGLVGARAEVYLLVDGTPPQPSAVSALGRVLAHSLSACCLPLAWAPWLDVESPVHAYSLCFLSRNQSADPACFDVGHSTSVLVSGGCFCPLPADGRAWTRLALAPPVFNEVPSHETSC